MYPKMPSPLAQVWGPANECKGLWRRISNHAHLKVAEEQNDKTAGKWRSLHCSPFPNLIPNWAYITQCLHQNILAKTSYPGRITQLNRALHRACTSLPMISETVITGGPSIPSTTQKCSHMPLTFNLLVSVLTMSCWCWHFHMWQRGCQTRWEAMGQR